MLDYHEMGRLWVNRNADTGRTHNVNFHFEWPFVNLGQVAFVKNYEARPNGGEPVQGSRYTFYEFAKENDTDIVILHSFVLPVEEGSSQFPCKMEGVWPCPKTYAGLEESLLAQYTPLHRTRKKVSLLAFIGMLYPADYPERSTAIEWMEKRVRTLLTGNIPPLVLEEYKTSAQVMSAYEEFDRWSHSCMTGDESQYTEIWGTNGKQARLIALKDEQNDEYVARCLVFRPCETTLNMRDAKALEDKDLGSGWYYGRIYGSTRNSMMSTSRCMDVAISHLESIGLRSVDLCPEGVVPLTVTEYSPYIDKGLVLWYDNLAVWAASENKTIARWRAMCGGRVSFLESYTDGSGFGNSRYDSTCTCCDDRYNSEDDGAYIEDYGSVCGCCLENNDDFVLDYEGTYRHADNCCRFVSRVYTTGVCSGTRSGGTSYDDGVWVRDNATTIRLWVNNEMQRVRLSSVDWNDGFSVYCPSDEVIETINGEDAWIGDPSLVDVYHKIVYANERLCIEEIEPNRMSAGSGIKIDKTWYYNDTKMHLDTSMMKFVRCGSHIEGVTSDDRRVDRWHRYEAYTIGSEANTLVVHYSTIPPHRLETLSSDCPKIGEQYNGKGSPLEVRVITTPIRLYGSIHGTVSISFAHLDVNFGKDVNNTRWYCGNINGYSVYDDTSMGACLSRAMASCDQQHFPLTTALYGNDNTVIGMQSASGCIVLSNVCVTTDSFGRIIAAGIRTGNDIRFVAVAHMFTELQNAVLEYNNSTGRTMESLTNVLKHFEPLGLPSAHHHYDHPLLSSCRLVNKETI